MVVTLYDCYIIGLWHMIVDDMKPPLTIYLSLGDWDQ